jgi:ribonuclease P protein component
VLPRAARLNSSGDFRSTIRRGVRVGRPSLVLHAGATPGRDGVRVGFVVSKAVGNAVTRNRVKRRLRHLAAAELGSTPPGVDVVVRALPRSAAPGTDLAHELASAWGKAIRRLGNTP